MIRRGREPVECGFCHEFSWAGRMDLVGNFLCEPCCRRGEALLEEERRAKKKGATT